jgi:hypothetical protein
VWLSTHEMLARPIAHGADEERKRLVVVVSAFWQRSYERVPILTLPQRYLANCKAISKTLGSNNQSAALSIITNYQVKHAMTFAAE